MSPAHERLVDAITRANDLAHAELEAEAFARKHPEDATARAKLEMAIRIGEDGNRALSDAKQKYEHSMQKS